MTARYTVEPIDYGPTDHIDRNAKWQVVDTRPVIERYETRNGVSMVEAKPPGRRQMAFCLKHSHAQLVASALNLQDDLADAETMQQQENVLTDIVGKARRARHIHGKA